WDAASQRVVLFGGYGRVSAFLSQNLSDTWTFDGRRWTKAADDGPPARRDASMVYDEASKQVVLFGGTGCQSLEGLGAGRDPTGQASSAGNCADTWTFNGTTWSQVSGAGPS